MTIEKKNYDRFYKAVIDTREDILSGKLSDDEIKAVALTALGQLEKAVREQQELIYVFELAKLFKIGYMPE